MSLLELRKSGMIDAGGMCSSGKGEHYATACGCQIKILDQSLHYHPATSFLFQQPRPVPTGCLRKVRDQKRFFFGLPRSQASTMSYVMPSRTGRLADSIACPSRSSASMATNTQNFNRCLLPLFGLIRAMTEA